jgi:hypothetical protein
MYQKAGKNGSNAPKIRLLRPGEPASVGFVPRPYAVLAAFTRHCWWFPVQEHQAADRDGMVHLWVRHEDLVEYNRNIPLLSTRKQKMRARKPVKVLRPQKQTSDGS